MRPVHPGEVLREQLLELGHGISWLAQRSGLPYGTWYGVIQEGAPVTAELAVALERVFPPTSAEFWCNLQSRHDLAKVREQNGRGTG